jgi:hypothetical protein
MSSYGYYGTGWYLYLAELLRKVGTPSRAYKIGITNARDPMLRLTYQGADEPFPIVKYFPDIHLIKYIWFPTKQEAERCERYIMWKIKQMTGTPRFHNWREKDSISGITEMRIWVAQEVKTCIQLMDERDKYELP